MANKLRSSKLVLVVLVVFTISWFTIDISYNNNIILIHWKHNIATKIKNIKNVMGCRDSKSAKSIETR